MNKTLTILAIPVLISTLIGCSDKSEPSRSVEVNRSSGTGDVEQKEESGAGAASMPGQNSPLAGAEDPNPSTNDPSSPSTPSNSQALFRLNPQPREYQDEQMALFLDIVQDPDGEIRTMYRQEAIEYCESQGGHLPSFREWAQLSASLGARGIVSSCVGARIDGDFNCAGYRVTNGDETKDEFDYSSTGYQTPDLGNDRTWRRTVDGDKGRKWFWSSSNSGLSYHQIIFDGSNGQFSFADYGTSFAVRCVANRNRDDRYRDHDSQMPIFQGIARNGDGDVKLMIQYEANAYCKKLGARLPSAHELAQLSMSLGARGIVELRNPEDGCEGVPGGGYSKVYAESAEDNFCFSEQGYQRPADELGKYGFWSSSIDAHSSGFALYFRSSVGDIDTVTRNAFHAVRCVTDKPKTEN